MEQAELIEQLVTKLKDVAGVQAIVLGGSHASGAQRPDSDIDLGLYYRLHSPLAIQHISAIAAELNDFPNPVVTQPGQWGRWVNGGAWLTIEGQHVDFLYRDLDFVEQIIDDCLRGDIQFDYLQQIPYGFHSYIYCTETRICHPLYDPNGIIPPLKKKVAHYPQPLKQKIVNVFLWDASFAFEIAQKSLKRAETYFLAGCLTRIASDLVQVLYALNETYFISDKRLYHDEPHFILKPANFAQRLDNILGNIGNNQQKLAETIQATHSLIREMTALAGNQYTPHYQLSL
jgi:predicted nucleotidyltransferase